MQNSSRGAATAKRQKAPNIHRSRIPSRYLAENSSHKLGYSDKLSLGGVDMRLIPASAEERKEGAFYRTKPGARIRPFSTFLLITLFQLVTAAALVVNVESDALIRIPISFLVLCAVLCL